MSRPSDKRRDDWRLRLGVPLGLLLLRLLASTWRFEPRGEAGWRARRATKQGIVLAAWHGHLLPLTFYLRNLGMSVVVSEHRDGEIIARVLHRLGYATIRGSSTRGGARALAGMVRLLRAGGVVTITPDGPRGPARQFAPGTTVAAQRAGVPIATMFVTTDRAWTLRSWDQFMIPKPFARVVLHFSDPTMVCAGTATDAAADAPRFEALLAPRAAGAGA
jgi:hypothetical protein